MKARNDFWTLRQVITVQRATRHYRLAILISKDYSRCLSREVHDRQVHTRQARNYMYEPICSYSRGFSEDKFVEGLKFEYRSQNRNLPCPRRTLQGCLLAFLSAGTQSGPSVTHSTHCSVKDSVDATTRHITPSQARSQPITFDISARRVK